VKRAVLLFIALVLVSAAAMSASVKPVQDPRRPAAGARPGTAASPAPHAIAAPDRAVPSSSDAALVSPAHEGHEAAASNPGADPHAEGQPGHAAEIANEAGEAEHAESPWMTAARLFNFAVLAGLLIYFMRSPFASFLDTRKVQIRKDLVDAAELRESATRQLAVIDQKLQALPAEIEALEQRGMADIAAEEERVRQAAEVERQRMLENAKREIARRAQLAERRLLQLAGELAIAVAAERVKKTITDADHRRLVDRYVEQVRPETIGS
jgi:F-type H+-transporting ATPase subunit b